MRIIPWQTVLVLLVYFGVVSCSYSSARSGVLDAQPFNTQLVEANLLVACLQTQSAGATSTRGAQLSDDECLLERANKYWDLMAKELGVQAPDLKAFIGPENTLRIDAPALSIIATFLQKREGEKDHQKWTLEKLSGEIVPYPFPSLNLPRQPSAKSLTVKLLSQVKQSAASATAYSDSEIKILAGLLESLQLSQEVKDQRFWMELLYGPEQLLIFLAFLWSVQKFLSTNRAIARQQRPAAFRWGQFWAGTVLVLGFVGTVRGMYTAIPFLSQALGGPGVDQSTAISSMATTLGPAFATTLIALALSIILSGFEQRTRSIADKRQAVLPS